MGHSPAKNLRALSFRISWLSLNPNSIAIPLDKLNENRSIASGQAQNEVADDVALHFGSAGLDGVAASAQVTIGPGAVIHGVRIVAEKLAVRAENFLGHLLDTLIQFAPKKFLDRAFGARNASGGHAAERAHLIEAHDFDFGVSLGQFLADDGIFRGRLAVSLKLFGKLDQPGHMTLENQVEARAVRTPFVHQRADGHVPAVVHFAQHIFFGNADVAEENFVELALASHLLETADFDPWRLHVHE